MIRACSVDDRVEWRLGDNSFVECCALTVRSPIFKFPEHGLSHTIGLAYIFHNNTVQTVFLQLGMGLQNCLGLLLGADGCDNGMTTGEEYLENMRGDETTTSCQKDTRHFAINIVILFVRSDCLEY